jgi:hypothetical protein
MAVHYVMIDGPDWQYSGETYVYLMATYMVACPPDRTCQVGMGAKWFGEPRGEKIRFSGEQEITVALAGQLHFRVDDGQGPCKVGFARKSAELIKWTWDS